MDTSGEEIWTHQNQPEMLELLTASVRANLLAQRLELLRLSASEAVAGSGLVAVFVPTLRVPLLITGALSVLLLPGFLRAWARRTSTQAALIQEVFDTGLFGLPWNSTKIGSRPPRYEIVRLASRVDEKGARHARNWYVNTAELPGHYAVLVCQLQNLGWDSRLRERWARILLAVAALWVGCGAVVGFAAGLDVGTLLLAWYVPALPALAFAVDGYLTHRDIARERRRVATDVQQVLDSADPAAPADPDKRAELARFARDVQDVIWQTRLPSARVPKWYYQRMRTQDEIDFTAIAAALVRLLASAQSASLKVFINYRTGDGVGPAARLDEELTRRLGAAAVFLAGRSITPGQQFVGELLRQVRDCDVLLAVIGRNWEHGLTQGGISLLDNPDDWVAREIREAAASGATIVPVLVGARARLSATDLPADLRWLAHLQYLHLPSGYGRPEVAQLVRTLLDRVLGRVIP
jgi:hypothetical protein